MKAMRRQQKNNTDNDHKKAAITATRKKQCNDKKKDHSNDKKKRAQQQEKKTARKIISIKSDKIKCKGKNHKKERTATSYNKELSCVFIHLNSKFYEMSTV